MRVVNEAPFFLKEVLKIFNVLSGEAIVLDSWTLSDHAGLVRNEDGF